jgi:hypothetical protein
MGVARYVLLVQLLLASLMKKLLRLLDQHTLDQLLRRCNAGHHDTQHELCECSCRRYIQRTPSCPVDAVFSCR